MGALAFYIIIYLLGYYATYILNLLTVRPWIHNRYISALIPVFAVGLTHAYMIVSSPPPQDQDISIGYALGFYIVMPIIIIIMGVLYVIWKDKPQHKD